MFMIYLRLGLQITIHTSSCSSWQTRMTNLTIQKLVMNTNKQGPSPWYLLARHIQPWQIHTQCWGHNACTHQKHTQCD